MERDEIIDAYFPYGCPEELAQFKVLLRQAHQTMSEDRTMTKEDADKFDFGKKE